MKSKILKASKPKTYRQRAGTWGERVAEDYMRSHGLQFVDRNVRTAYGEIDLVFTNNGITIFVEVKTRSNLEFGLPEEAVNSQKRAHLIHSAEAYMQNQPETAGSTWRIDVIAVTGKVGALDPEIVWFENAVA
jgi:putative endonuclease